MRWLRGWFVGSEAGPCFGTVATPWRSVTPLGWTEAGLRLHLPGKRWLNWNDRSCSSCRKARRGSWRRFDGERSRLSKACVV